MKSFKDLTKSLEESKKRDVKDMMGKKCESCKKGKYKETSFHDDMDGVLHCDKCGIETKRYKSVKESLEVKEEKINHSDIKNTEIIFSNEYLYYNPDKVDNLEEYLIDEFGKKDGTNIFREWYVQRGKETDKMVKALRSHMSKYLKNYNLQESLYADGLEEETLAESYTSKDLRNQKSFKVGQKFTNSNGSTFEIVDVEFTPHWKRGIEARFTIKFHNSETNKSGTQQNVPSSELPNWLS